MIEISFLDIFTIWKAPYFFLYLVKIFDLLISSGLLQTPNFRDETSRQNARAFEARIV